MRTRATGGRGLCLHWRPPRDGAGPEASAASQRRSIAGRNRDGGSCATQRERHLLLVYFLLGVFGLPVSKCGRSAAPAQAELAVTKGGSRATPRPSRQGGATAHVRACRIVEVRDVVTSGDLGVEGKRRPASASAKFSWLEGMRAAASRG
jgi:hypothetical protein